MSQSSPASDRDLASIAEARDAARRAKAALCRLDKLTQEQVDAAVAAMADAATGSAEALAALAVEETGYGVVADKVQKNLFASKEVHDFIRPMKTVGVVDTIEDRRVVEIAQPFGVVAAIIPSTNPTSTAIYKTLIAIKARCPIVLSPHPSAVRCITRTAELLAQAGATSGLPEGSIGWMQTVTLEGTQELMSHPDIAVILATGGMELVRAAYSAGKPAYGVGPGNAPAYIERTADIAKAVRDVMTGKTFDNGVLCSSENSVVVDREIAGDVRRSFVEEGAYFMSAGEQEVLARVLVTRRSLPNPALVGKSALEIASRAGLDVPPDTRVLIAELDGVGPEHPLSIEKLCPVLSFYEVDDWRGGCERCIEILQHGGLGHTMSIHSSDDEIIREFGLKKPAFRIVVNTPTTHGSIGLTTGLDPAMTLGCGGYGGNITSDNISPRHLLNIRRLAYEIRPIQASQVPTPAVRRSERGVGSGIDADALAARIDVFLENRIKGEQNVESQKIETAKAPSEPTSRPSAEEFVCEDDVRRALQDARALVIDDSTIVTPAAQDLAARHDVFVIAGLTRQRFD